MKTPLLLCALAAAAFAGCIGSDAQTTHALSIEGQDEASAGQMVRFAATAQENASAEFLFDFGDGTNVTVAGEGSAQAEHAYDAGGRYTVRVAMTIGNETADAVHEIHIIEHRGLEPKVIAAGPLANETATAQWQIAAQNASSVALNLSLENTMILGQSVVEIQVLGSDGQVLASQEVTLGESAVETVLIEADVDGDVVLRAVAHSGSATLSGSAMVLY